MASQLSRKIPFAELHCHLGGAVTPAIMWSIAHSQGIKLPTRDIGYAVRFVDLDASTREMIERAIDYAQAERSQN